MAKTKFIDSRINKLIAKLAKKQDKRILVLWASDCADHVLKYFELNYPDDERPGKAIEASRAWVNGEIKVGGAKTAASAAHEAARKSTHDEASAAARAAGHAAATAHVAGHAVHAATYAAKAVSYGSKISSPRVVTARERNWQFKHLLDLIAREES